MVTRIGRRLPLLIHTGHGEQILLSTLLARCAKLPRFNVEEQMPMLAG
ncbi:hypothetical protein MYXA107069_33015 [Myxococcus xanthus]|nr:hypothetical protein MyxoNM_10050 [Myxococcus xanthus]SDY27573.1 hypothetical protein SAMN05444383_1307 [Myxococcus xanthus]